MQHTVYAAYKSYAARDAAPVARQPISLCGVTSVRSKGQTRFFTCRGGTQHTTIRLSTHRHHVEPNSQGGGKAAQEVDGEEAKGVKTYK